MMRAMSTMLVVTISAFRSAGAQELTITGRVVSSDGAPLSMAFVNLDSSKIITRVDSTGHYILVVPASIAHGQPEKLQAMARGHIHKLVPVTLDGTSIVRDFVLQADTMPEHRRLHPMLSDGRTEKSATDIAITGRVTDSAGAAMPTAQVRLDPGGFGALTDDSGYYKLIIPASRRRQRALLSASLMGYGRSSDTALLTDDLTTRNFVLVKPIYSGSAAPLDAGSLRAMGLTDPRNGKHRKGEREIRLRMDNGYISSSLFRLVNRSGKVSGELVSFFPSREDEDSGSTPLHDHRALRGCGSGGEVPLPCRVDFPRAPDWARLWNSLDSLNIWNIVDEGTLRKRWSLVLDGSSITAEMWDGHAYKAWAYTAGVEDDGPGRAKVSAITSLLLGIGASNGP